MRGPVAIALALLVVAGSAAGGAASSTSGATLAVGGVEEGPTNGVGIGDTFSDTPNLRFIPHRTFAIGYGIQNVSQTPVVVTGANAPAPSNTLVRQIGVRFHRWAPQTCASGVSCPPSLFLLEGKAAHPRPFTIQPGQYLGLELDFRLGGCAQAPAASYRPISQVRLSLEESDGTAESTVLQLDPALSLRKPKPANCTFPRSRLYVDGPGSSPTSWLWTLWGSEGDLCTLEHGSLDFTSRAYQNGDFDLQRIEIALPHFTGKGVYRDAIAKLVVDGRTTHRSAGTLRVTKATGSEIVGTVDVGKPPPPSGRPVPYRIWGSMRCRVVR